VGARELLDDPSRSEAFANSVRGVAQYPMESAKAPKTVDTVGRAKGYGCEDEVEKRTRRSRGEDVRRGTSQFPISPDFGSPH